MEQASAKEPTRHREEKSVYEDEEEEEEEDPCCPLCIEELDATEIHFRPCPCGYRVCLFCYERIKLELKGICPSCRSSYGDPKMAIPPPTAAGSAAKRKSSSCTRQHEKLGVGDQSSVLGSGDKRGISPSPPVLASSDFPTLSSSPPQSAPSKRTIFERPRAPTPVSSYSGPATASSSSSPPLLQHPGPQPFCPPPSIPAHAANPAQPVSRGTPPGWKSPAQMVSSEAALASARSSPVPASASGLDDGSTSAWPSLKVEPPVQHAAPSVQGSKAVARESGKVAGAEESGAGPALTEAAAEAPPFVSGKKSRSGKASGFGASSSAPSVRASSSSNAQTSSSAAVVAGDSVPCGPVAAATATTGTATSTSPTPTFPLAGTVAASPDTIRGSRALADPSTRSKPEATFVARDSLGSEDLAASHTDAVLAPTSRSADARESYAESSSGDTSSCSSGGRRSIGGGSSASSSGPCSVSDGDDVSFSLSDELAELLLNSPPDASDSHLMNGGLPSARVRSGGSDPPGTQQQEKFFLQSLPPPLSGLPLAQILSDNSSVASPSFATWLSPHAAASAASLQLLQKSRGGNSSSSNSNDLLAGWGTAPSLQSYSTRGNLYGGSSANLQGGNAGLAAGCTSLNGGMQQLHQLQELQQRLQQAFTGVGWSSDEMQRASDIVTAAKQSRNRFASASSASSSFNLASSTLCASAYPSPSLSPHLASPFSPLSAVPSAPMPSLRSASTPVAPGGHSHASFSGAPTTDLAMGVGMGMGSRESPAPRPPPPGFGPSAHRVATPPPGFSAPPGFSSAPAFSPASAPAAYASHMATAHFAYSAPQGVKGPAGMPSAGVAAAAAGGTGVAEMLGGAAAAAASGSGQGFSTDTAAAARGLAWPAVARGLACRGDWTWGGSGLGAYVASGPSISEFGSLGSLAASGVTADAGRGTGTGTGAGTGMGAEAAVSAIATIWAQEQAATTTSDLSANFQLSSSGFPQTQPPSRYGAAPSRSPSPSPSSLSTHHLSGSSIWSTAATGAAQQATSWSHHSAPSLAASSPFSSMPFQSSAAAAAGAAGRSLPSLAFLPSTSSFMLGTHPSSSFSAAGGVLSGGALHQLSVNVGGGGSGGKGGRAPLFPPPGLHASSMMQKPSYVQHALPMGLQL